jgi:hypothetical protein
MPRIPALLDRGSVPGGKHRCSAPDCTRSRGHSSCATARCAKCCAAAGVTERLEGRDGSLLCHVHKKQITQAIAALNLPPAQPTNHNEPIEAAEDPNDGFLFFSSQGEVTLRGSSPPSRPSAAPPSAPPAAPPTLATSSPIASRIPSFYPTLATSSPIASRIPSFYPMSLQTYGSDSTSPLFSTPTATNPSTSTSHLPPSGPPRPPKPRDVPRAMPANLEFTRAGPSEASRSSRATQRAHREDAYVRPPRQVRVVFWATEV